ncbi:MAG TPA: hypothetical protein PL151_17430 [Phycisphaerae bacterium]|nr:hypothetical protein [Phycisphaerae bacterium]HOJ74982.1 hypothetical protein [Phycisphaerae bacterium]HOM51543.1 hypothetical protein [Phycisphaerae bacterium]HOQ85455.1 hypothetical protein [Phycisphaerae bacterium]HPP27071.1 hypothetical protein [Phycisphaerae bacterium]
MTTRLICCACVLAVLPQLVSAASPARVAPEDFAILPWSWIPNDAEMLKGIYECGFNLAGFVPVDALDAVQAAGLKAIVSGLHVNDGPAEDPVAVEKKVSALVERVGKHPAIYGYYLRDEPNAALFPALAVYVDALRKADPAARPYINLFPNYATAEQLGTATYDEYLERFITTVKPPFVSYDHYALMNDGSLRRQYFQNLEAVRKASLAHQLPFWNIVLSNAHFHYAEPYEGGFRFQAFTTLAYGGRGISYFTYTTPLHGNYRLAPLDQFGEKTATWDMLRRTNLQIHALAPTLVKLRSVGVFHHPSVPDGCAGLADSKHVANVSGGDLLMGEFEGPDGEVYVMLVNKDLHRSMYADIQFKQPGECRQVNNYTGKLTSWAGEGRWLAPGQGALLKKD